MGRTRRPGAGGSAVPGVQRELLPAFHAGAVIGGTSLMGGLGTIAGAFLGVLVLSILNDGFTLLGVSSFTFDIILGAAILIAMILNVRLQLLREAGRQ